MSVIMPSLYAIVMNTEQCNVTPSPYTLTLASIVLQENLCKYYVYCTCVCVCCSRMPIPKPTIKYTTVDYIKHKGEHHFTVCNDEQLV